MESLKFKFIDLFCGIGGFRIAAESFGGQCVFSSDIDFEACRTYSRNFGESPSGDITKINENSIPDHDILFAGFPCQPFSIIGLMNGMNEARGTLFFDVARIIQAKQPRWFVLENVKNFAGHDSGRTLKKLLQITKDLGYETDWHILNSLDYGLPQKRERVYIIGSKDRNLFDKFVWPQKSFMRVTIDDILEENVPLKYYASQTIQQKRLSSHISKYTHSIWHENKSGHISSYPYSCALRANASYNYLLVDGIRRLTPRELLRLQGFPDWFEPVSTDSEVRKQTGNAVSVPVVKAVVRGIINAEKGWINDKSTHKTKAKSRTSIYLEPVPS